MKILFSTFHVSTHGSVDSPITRHLFLHVRVLILTFSSSADRMYIAVKQTCIPKYSMIIKIESKRFQVEQWSLSSVLRDESWVEKWREKTDEYREFKTERRKKNILYYNIIQITFFFLLSPAYALLIPCRWNCVYCVEMRNEEDEEGNLPRVVVSQK